MLLVCAMLCGTLAQYAIAEEDLGTEVVVDMEEVTAPTEEVTAGTTEVPEGQDAALEAAEEPDDSATEEPNDSAADGQDVPEAADGETDDAETADTANAEDAADTPAEVPAESETVEGTQTTDIVMDEASDDAVVVDEESSVTINEIEVVGGNSGIATINAPDSSVTQDNYEGFKYVELKDTKTVMITGLSADATGIMTIPDEVIKDVTGTGEVRKKVVEIADNAFSGIQINGVLPSYLTTIGKSAFKNCTFTGTFTLPSTLTTIQKGAFEGCAFSGGLTIPASVKKIEKNAFKNCKFSGSLSLPAELETIEEGMFSGCSGLTGALKIPESVTTIGDSAFANCSGFTSLTFQGSAVKTIGESTFAGCSGLTGTLMIPAGVSVGASAFKDCAKLTAVNFGNLTSISDSMFENCSGLTGTLTIPAAITTIGVNAFKGCKGYSYLVFSDGLTSIGASAFEGCAGFKNGDHVGPALMFPSSLKNIGSRAFYGCSGMTGDLNLNGLNAPNIGQNAFFECGGFTGLILPGDTTGIHAQAIFDTIVVEDAESAIEFQDGESVALPKAYAGNNPKLELKDHVTWTVARDASSPNLSISVSAGTITANGYGNATLTVTAYNNKSNTRAIVVSPRVNGDPDNVAPTIKNIVFGEKRSVMRPDSLKLQLTILEEGSGVVALTGSFFNVVDPAQKISFSCDWANDRKYTGTVSDISIPVPGNAAVGTYCIETITLKDGAGNETSYTYNSGTGKWKNGNGNTVVISADTTRIAVGDRFSRDGATSKYITNKDGISSYLAGSAATLVISYDATNHTVLKDWMNAVKANQSKMILSCDAVEWSLWGAELSAASADFDCLITLENFDAIRYGNSEATMMVNLPGIGALPGKASVRIRADQMNGLYDQTNAIFVYSMNADATLTKQEIPVSYVQGNGQYWYEFQVTNATPAKLVLSAYELSLTPARSVTSIKLNKTTLGLRKGKTYTLKATVGPDYAENKAVTWKSSNTKVATVNSKGKITTKRYGKATITATAKDGSGVVGKCVLTVGYRIKYNLNGGKNNKKNPKIYYKTAFKLRKPTRSGYTFKGWYTDKYFKNRIKKIPKSYKRNLTLYAKWKKK